MPTLTEKEHREALIRRRIRTVVEYPAIGRLFRKHMNVRVERELFRLVQPSLLAGFLMQADYENWLKQTVEDRCWEGCARWPVKEIRWAHIAKILNIVVYEILANRELTTEADWQRFRP